MKKLISRTVRRLAWHFGISRRRARLQCASRILMFHSVGGDGQRYVYPQQGAYATQVFETELRYLSDNFSIVPLSRIVERLQRGEVAHTSEIALTFDDGLKNSLAIAYPLLQELGLPATFFVCPGLIETGGWQWSYEMPARLRRLSTEELTAFLCDLGAPVRSINGAMGWLANLAISQRMAIQEKLFDRTKHFDPTPVERFYYDLMTWEELASLDPALITIGSHTMSHPILIRTDEQQAKYEITESRRLLEKRLERPIHYFCYPDGAYDNVSRNLVQQTYLAAVSTQPGFVSVHDDIHLLPRIGAGTEDVHDLAWRLHRPHS